MLESLKLKASRGKLLKASASSSLTRFHKNRFIHWILIVNALNNNLLGPKFKAKTHGEVVYELSVIFCVSFQTIPPAFVALFVWKGSLEF